MSPPDPTWRSFQIGKDDFLTLNKAEEADQKIVRHMIQCFKSWIHHVVIRTVDTGVIVSLSAYRHHAQNFDSKVYALLVAGGKSVHYETTEIALKLGEKVCQGLPFFHALTGCDLTSSFFNQGKCKFWDRWMNFREFDQLSDVFVELSTKPTSISSDQLSLIEKYVCDVYYGNSSESLDEKRMKDFENSTHNNLRLLPPSRLGLKEHVKRSAYYAGWINHQCIENVDLPSPVDWGWGLNGGDFLPVWQTRGENITDADFVTMVCGCTTDKCSGCRCAKTTNFDCLQCCKCNRRCLYKLI